MDHWWGRHTNDNRVFDEGCCRGGKGDVHRILDVVVVEVGLIGEFEDEAVGHAFR